MQKARSMNFSLMSLSMIHFTSWFSRLHIMGKCSAFVREHILYGMGKGDMVKSGFGEFQGMRRKHSVMFCHGKRCALCIPQRFSCTW